MMIVIAFMLTGCGKQTLTCTTSQKQTGMTMNTKITALFENNEVTKMNLDVNIDVDNIYSDYAAAMKDMIDKQYDEYRKDGVTVNVTGEKNRVNASVVFDLKKMSDKDKKELDVYGTKKATAKELEKQGYTCK